MLANFIDDNQPSIPIVILAGKEALASWLNDQSARVKNWVLATGFEANSGATCLIADVSGNLQLVLGGAEDNDLSPFKNFLKALKTPYSNKKDFEFLMG